MTIDWLSITAALLAGLMGGLHCAAMCGGIAAGIALGTGGRTPLVTAVQVHLGRGPACGACSHHCSGACCQPTRCRDDWRSARCGAGCPVG